MERLCSDLNCWENRCDESGLVQERRSRQPAERRVNMARSVDSIEALARRLLTTTLDTIAVAVHHFSTEPSQAAEVDSHSKPMQCVRHQGEQETGHAQLEL